MYYVPRGGTRGGADQFKWDDVKSDKDRECYLGHSLMAPVGRWQQGKDLQWFNKDREGGQQFQNEMKAVKHAERKALMTALGQEVPKVLRKQPKPDVRQTPEPQQSRKSGSKAKNVPMLKPGLSLKRTMALLRDESTSKSKIKKKMKKEKKKKSKDQKRKKKKESSESSSSTDSDSSDYYDSSNDDNNSSRRHKRPNKQLSLKHQRSGTTSQNEDERTTFSYKRNLKHQSHCRQENDKRTFKDSISDNEDRLSRSKFKEYLDKSTQFIGKGCRVDSANSKSNKYPSRNDSSDDDQGIRRTARSSKKNKSYKVTNAKSRNRYRGQSPEGYHQRRSWIPEDSERRGAKNEAYNGDKTYQKYRQSRDEGRDGRHRRTSQSESRHREFYK